MRKLLVILLALITLFTLAGCNDEGKTDGESTSPEIEADTAEISILKDGVFAYKIVRPDIADDDTRDSTVTLRRELSNATGCEVEITTDWEGKNAENVDTSGRLEILIGLTNRPESIRAHEALTDEYGYSITIDGNKIVVAANYTPALYDAVDALLAALLGVNEDGSYKSQTEVSIMSNLNLTGTKDFSKRITLLVSDDRAPSYTEGLISGLESLTSKLTVKTWDDEPKDVFDIDEAELVVICGADTVPVGTMSSAAEYLGDGGRILTLGGPPFANTLYETDGVWMTHEEYITSLAGRDETHIYFDTNKSNILKRFSRSSNDMKSEKTISLDVETREGASMPAITVDIENLTSWDNMNAPFTMPKGDNSIAFWVKGGPNTTSIYIEVSESDGSRWYATPKVTEEWAYKILTSGDFVYWADGNGRGGSGDSVDLTKIKQIAIGLAKSGQPALPNGKHHYSISEIATLNFKSGETTEITPKIDGFAPQYKFYEITNGKTISAHKNQVFVSDAEYKLDSFMYSVAPGRQGTGYGNARQHRFIPLLEVYDEKGLRSGFAAWMYIFESLGDLQTGATGGMLASFGATDGEFYDEAGLSAVLSTAKALMRDTYLIEGGTDEYIYIDSETKTLRLGAVASGTRFVDTTVKVSLYNGDKLVHELNGSFDGASPVKTIHEDKLYSFEESYTLGEKPTRAVTELIEGGVVCDRLEHEVDFWVPDTTKGFVYYENGSYMRDGERINLFGINYMPSSGMATDLEGGLFEYYVSPAAYDPEVFYHDLLRVKDIGFNSVSIFVYAHTVRETANMLHLIEMCRELDILVDLSIRPSAYPFSYNEQDVEDLIKKLHFYENNNIVAYDIAWEATIGTYDKGSFNSGVSLRRDLDEAWLEWIDVEYGSLEAAEAVWGARLPRVGGKPVGASDAMLSSAKGSEFTKLVAAYRRFIDDAVSARFTYVADHIKSMAPNQLVSFRMQTAGSPDSDPAQYHYDFQSLASSLDFMSPEAYQLSLAADNIRSGLYANIYARYVKPGSLVNWKEFGYSIWRGSNIDTDLPALEYQAEFYREVYEMCLRGYTAATYCWYFTPGYRAGENSDYGVLNPDGSDRPVTAVIREYAEKFANIGEMKAPDYYIEIDRDEHPDTMRGIYYEIKDELLAAVDSGKTVAFTNEAVGKNIADVIDIAVGDAVTDNGIYPRKYVNGLVSQVEHIANDGKKTYITDNGTVTANGSLKLELDLTNTSYAAWSDGQVTLVDASSGEVLATLPALDYLEKTTITVELPAVGTYSFRFAFGDILFGNDYTVTIK